MIKNTISNSDTTAVNCKPHGDCEININDNLADDSRKIFVGGLSWETNEEDLRKYFSEFGEVKSCIIKLDRYTNHSRGFGFVIFDSEDTVNRVLERKEHILNKKKIDPKKAKPSREPQRKIFIGGLDPDLAELDIKEYFSQFGEIENIETPFDIRKNKRKAYIFVTFANEIEARKAASQEFQEINGKKFEVRIAIPREQANRGKTYSDSWKEAINSSSSYSPYYPYTMLPYMYPEYFYYMFNNNQFYNNCFNNNNPAYDLLNYDNLSRQLSTGLMINNNNQSTTALLKQSPAPIAAAHFQHPKSASNNTTTINNKSNIDTQSSNMVSSSSTANGIINFISSSASLSATNEDISATKSTANNISNKRTALNNSTNNTVVNEPSSIVDAAAVGDSVGLEHKRTQ